MLTILYHEILYRPLFNALVLLTNVMPGHDIGFAIITLTLLVRAILFPFSHRALTTQHKLKSLEPEIEKIKKDHKDNAAEQGKRMMELYKAHGVSPFSGCTTLLIQLPLLIALYHVFWRGISLQGADLYPFVAAPETVRTIFLGLVDLTKPNIAFALLAGISQFLQIKLATPSIPPGGGSMQSEMARAMAIQSLYIFPVLIFILSLRFPSALPLYWTVTNLFATVHEGFLRSRVKRAVNAGPAYEGGRNKNQGNNQSPS